MRNSTIAICTGAKESGKTYTARRIIALHPRIYALEPHGMEFALPGLVTARNEEEFSEAVRANWKRSAFLICYTPDYEIGDASEHIAEMAFRRGNVLAVFDEAHDYLSASQIGPEMRRLVTQSRHRNVNLVFCSPRLSDISTTIRTQADLWIVAGVIWTARDLDVIEENTSPEFRRAAQEPLAHGQHRVICFDTRTREMVEPNDATLRERFRMPLIAAPRLPAKKPKPQSLFQRFMHARMFP